MLTAGFHPHPPPFKYHAFSYVLGHLAALIIEYEEFCYLENLFTQEWSQQCTQTSAYTNLTISNRCSGQSHYSLLEKPAFKSKSVEILSRNEKFTRVGLKLT